MSNSTLPLTGLSFGSKDNKRKSTLGPTGFSFPGDSSVEDSKVNFNRDSIYTIQNKLNNARMLFALVVN